MKRIDSQKGQALILIAFGIIALIGFTALAVDGGRVFSDRRNAQNAADTAALAAALDEIYAQYGKTTVGYEQAGLTRATQNGYNNDGTQNIVTVMFCDDALSAGDPCEGLPSGADESEYIRVRIISNVRMTFARVLGREFVTNKVEAVTRVQGSLTTSAFNAGAGFYSVKGGNYDDCFKVLGNSTLTFHDTGIFVNCAGADALSMGGSSDITMDANAEVVGCSNDKNKVPPPIKGTGTITCGATAQTITKETFKDVPTVDPTPTCSGSGQKNGNTWSPGNYGSESITSTITFLPGNYCFSNLSVKPSGNIAGSGGTVRLVLSNDISLKGTANVFSDLELYMNAADLDIFGSLAATRLRFFGNGNSSFNLNAHAELTSYDAYIYSETGNIDFAAQSIANISAPPADDKYGGLLMYMPWDNPNDFQLNGGTNNTWKGTILMPSAEVTYNGGSDFKLYGQVIADTFNINGGSTGDIYFTSDFTYSPPNNPTIEFTK